MAHYRCWRCANAKRLLTAVSFAFYIRLSFEDTTACRIGQSSSFKKIDSEELFSSICLTYRPTLVTLFGSHPMHAGERVQPIPSGSSPKYSDKSKSGLDKLKNHVPIVEKCEAINQ